MKVAGDFNCESDISGDTEPQSQIRLPLDQVVEHVVLFLHGLQHGPDFVNFLHTGTASVNDFYELRLTGYPARFQSRIAALRDNSLAVKKCLEDLEMDIARRLSWLAFATRVGPMLGLVGTLVPLGPALTGLAAGDIQALSGNLVIAFTTTVFGILVGGFAYAASLVRRAWYEQDLSDLEFIASLLNPQPEPCRA